MAIDKEVLLTAAQVVLHKNSLTDGDLPDFLSGLSDNDAALMNDFIKQMHSDAEAQAFEELRKQAPDQIAQGLG